MILYFILQTKSYTLSNPSQTLSNYNTLNPSTSYSLSFTFNNNVANTDKVRISFSKHYNINSTSLTNCKSKTVSGNSLVNTPCSVSYNSGTQQFRIVFTGVFLSTATYTYLQTDFMITNPWAATSQTLTVQILDNADTLKGSGTVLITYFQSSLTSCSFQSSSMKTGESSTYTVKFTPNVQIISSSYIIITMPMWFVPTSLDSQGVGSLTCSGTQNTDAASLSCLISSSTYQTINITGWANSNRTSGQIKMTISPLKNPWSEKAFGPIKFQLLNLDGFVTQSCSNIMQSSMTTINNFNFVFYSLTNKVISGLNTALLNLFNTNPVPISNSQLRIVISGGAATYLYTGSATKVFQNTTTLVLSGFLSTDLQPGNSISITGLKLTFPPCTKPFTITFNTELNQSSIIYKIQQSSLIFQATAGIISSATISATNLFINRDVAYRIIFSTVHYLASGGFINIIFPPQLTINTGNGCTLSGSGYSAFCTITSSSNITILSSTAIPASTTINVTINSVNNGGSQIETTSFKIYTYYYNLDYDSLVDKLQSGATVTLISGQISTFSVTPANLTTLTVTDYQFHFELNSVIPQNGYIRLDFPSQIKPTPLNITILSATFSITSCIINQPSIQRVQIKNCFQSGDMTNLNVTFMISGITNPESLETSSTIVFQTFTANDQMLNFVSSGLTVTLNNAINVNSFSIISQNSIVNQISLHTYHIQHIKSPSLNDYLIIILPSPMMFSSTAMTVCSATLNSNITSISCTYIDLTHLRVDYNSISNGKIIQFTINSVKNYQISNYPINVRLQFYKSSNYLSEKGTCSMVFNQATISTFTVSNDQKIAFNQESEVTISVTLPFDLDPAVFTDSTKITLLITIPTAYSLPATISCLSSSGSCSNISTTKFQITNIGNILSIAGISFTLTNLQLPQINQASNSFTIQYLYETYNISTINTGITISPYCNAPCQRCRIPRDVCESCLISSTPNTFICYDPISLICLQSCIDGKYPDSNNVCLPCVSPCVFCSSNLDCLTCISNTWLHLNRCINPCPDKFYQGIAVCQNCSIQCAKCSDGVSCDQCQTGYYLDSTITSGIMNCNTFCPSTYYPEDSTKICEPCISPCLQCIGLGLNDCLTCISTKVQYQNTCIDSCPSQYFNVSGKCQTCQNCLNCISAAQCSQCIDGYYLQKDIKVCVLVCPSEFPITNSRLKTCQPCDTGCSQCTSLAQNCSACIESYFLYENSCNTTCPDSYFQNTETHKCQQMMKQLPSVYTPLSGLQVVSVGVVAGSGFVYPYTAVATCLGAFVSVFQNTGWMIFSVMVYYDTTLQASQTKPIKDAAFYTAISVLFTMFVMSIIYVTVAYIIAKEDKGFKDWINYHPCCLHTYRILCFLAIFLNFRIFRLLYSQFLNKINLSAYFEKGQIIFGFTNKMSYISIVLCDVPMITVSAMTLAFKIDQAQNKGEQFPLDSVFFACIENIVLGILCIIFIIIDSLKDKTYFQKMAGQMPFASTSVNFDF